MTGDGKREWFGDSRSNAAHAVSLNDPSAFNLYKTLTVEWLGCWYCNHHLRPYKKDVFKVDSQAEAAGGEFAVILFTGGYPETNGSS